MATAIENKHKDRTFADGSPYRYTPGRAFTAPRERSHDRLRATALSPREIIDLTLCLDGSSRKMKHRRFHVGATKRNPSAHGDRYYNSGLRARASLDSYGPSLQRSTSGLAFDDSDKENGQRHILKTPIITKTNRSPFSRPVLRGLDIRDIRNNTLPGFTNVAANAIRG